jgi:hypothetical protein
MKGGGAARPSYEVRRLGTAVGRRLDAIGDERLGAVVGQSEAGIHQLLLVVVVVVVVYIVRQILVLLVAALLGGWHLACSSSCCSCSVLGGQLQQQLLWASSSSSTTTTTTAAAATSRLLIGKYNSRLPQLLLTGAVSSVALRPILRANSMRRGLLFPLLELKYPALE